MNIVYVASEVAPFAKTGGLADVAGALPKFITEMGHVVTVIMPFYRQVKLAKQAITDTGKTVSVPIMGKAEAVLPNGEALNKRVTQDLTQLAKNQGGDREKVESTVAAELKTRPNDVRLLNQLATLKAKGGNFPEAGDYYQKAL